MKIRKLILAALVFGLHMNLKAQNNFKVLPLTELDEIRRQKDDQVESDYIQEDNSAFVTLFKDGTAVISPPVLGGDEGLYFLDRETMKKMVASASYPVKGTGSFWEREKERILDLENQMPYFLEKLSKLFGMEVKVSQDIEYLGKLSQAITSTLKSKPKNRKDIHLMVGLYVAEVIRTRENARWGLFPLPSLNMAYEPEVVKGTIACSPYSYVVGQLEMASFLPVDLQKLISVTSDQFFNTGNRRYLIR